MKRGRWGGGYGMVKYAPGGVMSVATANALKVEWPAVCQKGICQRLVVIRLS